MGMSLDQVKWFCVGGNEPVRIVAQRHPETGKMYKLSRDPKLGWSLFGGPTLWFEKRNEQGGLLARAELNAHPDPRRWRVEIGRAEFETTSGATFGWKVVDVFQGTADGCLAMLASSIKQAVPEISIFHLDGAIERHTQDGMRVEGRVSDIASFDPGRVYRVNRLGSHTDFVVDGPGRCAGLSGYVRVVSRETGQLDLETDIKHVASGLGDLVNITVDGKPAHEWPSEWQDILACASVRSQAMRAAMVIRKERRTQSAPERSEMAVYPRP